MVENSITARVLGLSIVKLEQYCDYRVETQGDGDPLGQKYYDAIIDDLIATSMIWGRGQLSGSNNGVQR